ncbi:MAG: restriction endonuclease subunit S [Lachnospiraceae bacterium]|nr:restriction endonuclease subunit S [Butyrivibrio sp.]MCM1342232.1 restriction endonuclease subunit S [Muribaculaceae bacterium]MCM1409193.1 restriction endonuclease subunit S [Lachnospiraceae bacterium]
MKKLEEIFVKKDGVFIKDTSIIRKEKEFEDDVPFLRPSKSMNNLLVGYVRKKDMPEEWLKKIAPAHSIIIGKDGEGSHSYSYVYPHEFLGNSNTMFLIPHGEYADMSLNQKLWYAQAISFNRYRFSYGNKPKKDRMMKIEFPEPTELPEYVPEKEVPDVSTIPECFMEDGYDKACWYLDNVDMAVFESDYKGQEDKENRKRLEFESWKEYTIGELFILHQGNGYELMRMEEDRKSNINFISRTSKNNGVVAKVKKTGEQPFPKGLISVALGGSVLSSFVQDEPFYTAYHVMVLEPKEEYKMSSLTKMFICTQLEANKYKYSYGRQANRTLKDIIVRLPMKKDKQPDFEWIDVFMRSLNYSKAIDSVD